jgi:hypothetical protein
MSKLIKFTTILFLFAILFITACNTTVPSVPTTDAPLPETETTTASPDTGPQIQQVVPGNKVEVVYFHMPSRCAKCLCFEERVTYVINTYFQNEMDNGTLTLTICDLSDGDKAPLIRKYGAFGSQLFVNTVVNNIEDIKNIEDIWNWHCLDDTQGFDTHVKDLIDQALNKVR